MKRLILAVAVPILLLWSALSSYAAPQTQDKAATDPITEISLERTACFGACPIDKVTLHADGTATYHGERFVEQLGQYKGAFYSHDFERLVELIKAQQFFALKDRYAVPATDLPSIIISVTRNGKSKTVTDYGGDGPLSLWTVQAAIRGVASDIKWQKGVTKQTSGIRGVAMQSPVMGGPEWEDQPNKKPLPGAIITLQSAGGGAEITRIVADENGKFEIPLAPGKYLIVALAPNPKSRYPRGSQQPVTVEADKYTDVVVEYDTGIR